MSHISSLLSFGRPNGRPTNVPAPDEQRSVVADDAWRSTRMENLANRWPMLSGEARQLASNLRDGRFQRLLSLTVGGSSLLAGAEVAYNHYLGGFSHRVMYTPIILSAGMSGAGFAAFFSARAARTVLPAVCVLTVVDAGIGSYFHARGIARKPGGWRLPVTNIINGPPIMAPLLFGSVAYLGLVAASLDREGSPAAVRNPVRGVPSGSPEKSDVAKRNPRVERLGAHMALATAVAAGATGFEALYSHYKGGFRYRAQWLPVVTAPLLVTASLGSIGGRRAARKALPAVAVAAMLVGGVGSAFHARGVRRRPGGSRLLAYNILHGPPMVAPLLLSSAGLMGLLASFMGRTAR